MPLLPCPLAGAKMPVHLWRLFTCSFLNPPSTNKESSSDESNSVPVEDASLPAANRGDGPVPQASSGSDAARHDEQGRHERGREAEASLPAEEGERIRCTVEDAKEEYLVKAGGVIIKPYHWQGKYLGPPVLTICTTGSRAARLQLKEGLVV